MFVTSAFSCLLLFFLSTLCLSFTILGSSSLLGLLVLLIYLGRLMILFAYL